MTKLFQTIEALIPTLDGWCSPSRGCLMAATVLATRPAICCEIGCWGGRATIAMALACKAVGYGQVIAIDPWDRDASMEGQTGKDLEWWAKVDHEIVFKKCIGSIEDATVGPWVTIHRKRSDVVTPPSNIGILALDGNHSMQAVRDCERYAPNVLVGGFMFSDDERTDWPGPKNCIPILKRLGFEKKYEVDSGACYQRVSMENPGVRCACGRMEWEHNLPNDPMSHHAVSVPHNG